MKKENMNNLAIKFLSSIKSWLDMKISERTRNCLRTKIAVITKINKDNTFSAVLAGDYQTLLNLKEQKKLYDEYIELKKITSPTPEQEKRLKELEIIMKTKYNNEQLSDELYRQKEDMLTLDNLTTIKNDNYNLEDYVVIGYIDNKLTNAFILYKNIKKGVF